MSISKETLYKEIKKQPDIDKQNNVTLFCSEYNVKNSYLNNCRGIVYHGDNLFFKGFPYTTELTSETIDSCDQFDFSQCRFFESHEGTLIRVFNIDGKWYTSTNRKLDAFKSRWASRHTTFGQRFCDAIRELVDENEEEDEDSSSCSENSSEKELTFSEKTLIRNNRDQNFLDDIYQSLDVNKKYMFILKPSMEERIICKPEPTPTIYHVGTFDQNNKLLLDEKVTFNKIQVDKPKEVIFDDLHDLKTGIMNTNISYHQGYLAIQQIDTPHYEPQHFKLLHPRYSYLFSVRGNVPSLNFRYLQLRKYGTPTSSVDEKMFHHFLDLYEFQQKSEQIESEIYDVCHDLFTKYLIIFVNKAFIQITDLEQEILHNCIHYAYKNTGIITTLARINNLLTLQKPSTLNSLMKEYRIRQINSES